MAAKNHYLFSSSLDPKRVCETLDWMEHHLTHHLVTPIRPDDMQKILWEILARVDPKLVEPAGTKLFAISVSPKTHTPEV
jgi:hypothetical protein